MPTHEAALNDSERAPLTSSRPVRRKRFRCYFYIPWLSVAFWVVMLYGVVMVTVVFARSQRWTHMTDVLLRAHCKHLENASDVSHCIQMYLD